MKKTLFLGLMLVSTLQFSVISLAQESGSELEKGIWHYKHENYEEAVELLKGARSKDPDSSLAAYYLGITYKQLQDYKKARPNLEAAVMLKPPIKGALMELIDLLYKLGETEEAKKWINVAEKEDIRPAQIAFLKGLILIKEGTDLDGAIKSLEEAKKLDDSLTQVSDYHIGIAHLKAKSLEDAKMIFKEIITRDPTTSLALFANQYMDAITQRLEQTRPFKFTAATYYQYDDNVVLKPDDDTIATEITEKGDGRQVYTASAEYNIRAGERFGTKLGYSFYFADQFNLDFYDTMSNNFSIQPTFYFKDIATSIPLTYNHLMVNEETYLYTRSIGNLTNITLGGDNMLQGSFVCKNKDYRWDPTTSDEDRDANEYLWSLADYYFFAKRKGFVNLKYTMNIDDTEGRNWRYFGNQVAVTSLIPLHEKAKLTLAGRFFLQNFLKRHTIYDKKREDTTFQLSSLLSIEIFKNTELQFQYTFIDKGSNLKIYDYTRNIYSAGVQYKF